MKTGNHKLNLTRHSSNQLVYDSLKLVNGILVAALIATRTVDGIANHLRLSADKAKVPCCAAV